MEMEMASLNKRDISPLLPSVWQKGI